MMFWHKRVFSVSNVEHIQAYITSFLIEGQLLLGCCACADPYSFISKLVNFVLLRCIPYYAHFLRQHAHCQPIVHPSTCFALLPIVYSSMTPETCQASLRFYPRAKLTIKQKFKFA